MGEIKSLRIWFWIFQNYVINFFELKNHWGPLSQTCPWPRLWLCTDWKFWTDSFVLSKVIHFFPKAHIFHYYMHGQDISALTLCNFWYFCLMFVHWCFLQNLFCKYLILWCYLIFWSSKIVFFLQLLHL